MSAGDRADKRDMLREEFEASPFAHRGTDGWYDNVEGKEARKKRS